MSRFVHWGRSIALGAACAALASPAWCAAPARARTKPGGTPVMWQTYDLLVNLQDLPKTYTCDDLWYAFRGILLRLGAPPATLDVTPYDCSPSPQGSLRSPRVELRAQLPAPVLPSLAKLARLRAITRTVRIGPGEPKTLKPADCRLLEQIEQTLLASLPVHVLESHFDCGAPAPRGENFSVTLRQLVIEPTKAVAPR